MYIDVRIYQILVKNIMNTSTNSLTEDFDFQLKEGMQLKILKMLGIAKAQRSS